MPDIVPDAGQDGSGAIMRKAELEDALALADLLNLPTGGGSGGSGAGKRKSGKVKGYGGGGAGSSLRHGSGRAGRPPQRASAAGW